MRRKRRARRTRMVVPRPSGMSVSSSSLQKRKMVRNIVGFVLAFIAGILATVQGYQGITGAALTGNVIGVSINTGVGGLAVIFGILILAGAFLMVITETMRVGGVLIIILGVLSAIVTFGASLVPALIAVVGGFLGMTAE